MAFIFVYILVSGILAFLVHRFLRSDSWIEPEIPDQFYTDGYFRLGDPKPDDTKVEPFTIPTIDDERLQDLRRRLSDRISAQNDKDDQDSVKNTENADNHGQNEQNVDNSCRQYSTPTRRFLFLLDSLIDYWTESYDWRMQEQQIKQLDHYRTEIEGLQVHFIKITSSNDLRARKNVGLLLISDAWPSNFTEYVDICSLFRVHDGSDGDKLSYTIVVPSVPGSGYSTTPARPFDSIACARVFDKLMSRLGHHQYYALGSGHWGSQLARLMATGYEQRLLGIQLIGPLCDVFNVRHYIRLIMAKICPTLMLDNPIVERNCLPKLSSFLGNIWQDSGCDHLEATKPEIVASALSGNNPIGLAAYLMGRFFSNDCEITPAHRDRILTVIMIHYLTSGANLSDTIQLCQETVSTRAIKHVPCGLNIIDNDIYRQPISFLKSKYKNIVYQNWLGESCQYLSLENPKLLIREIKRFIHTCENLIENSDIRPTNDTNEDASMPDKEMSH